jgi:hypothetical protein
MRPAANLCFAWLFFFVLVLVCLSRARQAWSFDTLQELAAWPAAHPRQTVFGTVGGESVRRSPRLSFWVLTHTARAQMAQFGVTDVLTTDARIYSCGVDGRVLWRSRAAV